MIDHSKPEFAFVKLKHLSSKDTTLIAVRRGTVGWSVFAPNGVFFYNNSVIEIVQTATLVPDPKPEPEVITGGRVWSKLSGKSYSIFPGGVYSHSTETFCGWGRFFRPRDFTTDHYTTEDPNA